MAAFKLIRNTSWYLGLSTDTKPGAGTCPAGSTAYETNSGNLYITPDGGTTWTLKVPETLLVDATGAALVGQKTMAASIPVVIASNQGAVSVSGPLTDAELRAVAVPVSGTVTANQGTAGAAAWPVKIDQTTPGTTDRVTVGGTVILAATPTLQIAGAYTAKDAVGGKLTFTGAARVSGGTGVIHAVTIIDRDSEAAELVLVLFDQDFTATDDAAAFDPSDADLANVVAKITIAASDYQAFADNGVAQKIGLGIPFKLTGSANLYGQLMCTGTPTYTAAGDLTVKVHILQD